MGTHIASTLVEEIPGRIDDYISIAPSSFKPSPFIYFLSTNLFANRILEKLLFSKNATLNVLKVCKRLNLIDRKGFEFLAKEIATSELRLSFYACITYLRFLDLNEALLVNAILNFNINFIAVFGQKDVMYPPSSADFLLSRLPSAKKIIIDTNHELINQDLVKHLEAYLA